MRMISEGASRRRTVVLALFMEQCDAVDARRALQPSTPRRADHEKSGGHPWNILTREYNEIVSHRRNEHSRGSVKRRFDDSPGSIGPPNSKATTKTPKCTFHWRQETKVIGIEEGKKRRSEKGAILPYSFPCSYSYSIRSSLPQWLRWRLCCLA